MCRLAIGGIYRKPKQRKGKHMSAYLKQWQLSTLIKQGDFERLVPFGPLMTKANAESMRDKMLQTKFDVLMINTKAE